MESSGDDEDGSEFEAMLYSKIHYDELATSYPDGLECKINNLEFTTTHQGLVEESREQDEQENNLQGYKTPSADSGCGLSRPNSSFSEHLKSGLSSEVDSDNDEESRYTAISKPTKVVSNPYFCSENSDSDSDTGIVILPKREKTPPEVICIDSDSPTPSPRSPLLITDSDTSDDEITRKRKNKNNFENLEVVEVQNESYKEKNNKRKISSALKVKGKLESYRKEFGSDFEDNFSSGDSNIGEFDESTLSLNLSGTHCRSSKRKVSDIFEADMTKARESVTERPDNWTAEMDLFYNSIDERNLDLELEDIHSTMPANSNWAVDRSDIYSGGYERPRYFQGKRCNNCNQFGHLLRNCPDPIKVVRCSMCGSPGHVETRCPQKSCLRCGQPGFSFLESCMHCRRLNDTECRLCGFLGHTAMDCPDLWRRFHATTKGTTAVKPSSASGQHKKDKDCWCCNCGRKGHSLDNCQRYRYSKYPPTSVRVISYGNPLETEVDDYGDVHQKKRKGGKNKKERSMTCPNSPVHSRVKSYRSEPSSPYNTREVGDISPIKSCLVEKAVKKMKNRSNHIYTSTDHTTNKINCVSKRFNKKKGCNESPKKNKYGEKYFPRNKNQTCRANLIPTNSKSACKFLKKEIQKSEGTLLTDDGRRIKRYLKNEVYGMKSIQSSVLKKVERKNLADLVIQLRSFR